MPGPASRTTGMFICGKVRRFDDRVYGDDRLLYPAVRRGRQGLGRFERVTWDEALELIAAKIRRRATRSAPSRSCPTTTAARTACSRATSRTPTLPAAWRVAAGAHGLRGADRRGRAAMYGKMPASPTRTTRTARLIVVWGCNPSASGIHLVSHIKRRRKRGATLVVIDPRATPLARQADLHLAVRPGTDLPVALALIHRDLFDERAGRSGVSGRAHAPASRICARAAAAWTLDRAAAEAGVDAARAQRVRRVVRDDLAGRDSLRLGPGTQPQRRRADDGHPGAAGGGRQVRRPRRRLHDEQLRRVGHRRPNADRRARRRRRAS